MALIAKQNKSERLYRKLSNREIEVLRFLSDGKKNNEISKILSLNEKTISTYKLRLLTKLNVTNLVDLVNSLVAFETYSSECENLYPHDFEIHQLLHRTTAAARALLETGLAKVIEAEGISAD